MDETFAREVLEGLTSSPKWLPSKYFYDKEGDHLFQRIMKLDEYYLTRCEHEILTDNKEILLKLFTEGNDAFNLVEFGAGDGFKTRILLKYFLEKGADVTYVPIDISANVLGILEKRMKEEFPDLPMRSIQGDYFSALHELENGGRRNVILFLGSNIGNFRQDQSFDFLRRIYEEIQWGDMMLIGFDLKKDPSVIRAAYNDKEGVTKAFNLNLLHRINRELEAGIKVDRFMHYPIYNPLTGTASSYLVSTEEQEFTIRDQKITLEAWEAIHTEISQKFSDSDISRMASLTGFTDLENFQDKRHYFVDAVWKK